MAGGRVAVSGDGSVAASADHAAQRIATETAVVVAVHVRDKDAVAAVIAALIVAGAGGDCARRKVGTEFRIDDVILFVDAALGLGLPVAAGRERDGSGCEERGEDLGGAAHGLFSLGLKTWYGRLILAAPAEDHTSHPSRTEKPLPRMLAEAGAEAFAGGCAVLLCGCSGLLRGSPTSDGESERGGEDGCVDQAGTAHS